jgi:hypothetical protein
MIKCRWMENQQILINPDGQVWPCCYFANIAFYLKSINQYDAEYEITKDTPFKEYDEHKAELNIFNNDLQQIIQHEWYTKTLPESWNSEKTTHVICKKVCSYNTEENKYCETELITTNEEEQN